jgi:RHS repeat-associated protein
LADYRFTPASGISTLIREYIWANGQAVVVFEGGQLYFVRSDHIGRPVFATSDTGTVVWTASYLPFGGVRVATGTPTSLRFPGQWFQAENGLHQNWMRDYDPTTGRYLQADPLGLIDGASVYGYARQSPGMYVDPRGEQGGPYHPPVGVRTRCNSTDSCPLLNGKIFLLYRMIHSHLGFDLNMPNRGLPADRHASEIAELGNALERCLWIWARNCINCTPPRNEFRFRLPLRIPFLFMFDPSWFMPGFRGGDLA